MKKFFCYVAAAFFVAGAALWFWVAYTEPRPELPRAAFYIALGPTSAAILFAHKARWIRKPDQK